MRIRWILFFICHSIYAEVHVGIEVFTQENGWHKLQGKRVGLVTNHSAIDRSLCSTREIVEREAKKHKFTLAALFAPEHGISGSLHASEEVKTQKQGSIPIYSLHGETRRPTRDMLRKIDIILFDVQDIGSRSYTYINTLFYVMEEAARAHIPVLVFDRPNPINGITIDGPMLKEGLRSFVGYIQVPYCHGMTIGELAQFFNAEYDIKASLEVIAMKGWQRTMTFADTHLPWIPTSPHIPEASTCFFYPMTGLLGELQIVSIGIGYTLPFKVVGAPWICAEMLAKKLEEASLSGIKFVPFHYKPFYHKFAQQECHGVLLLIENPSQVEPVLVEWALIGALRSLYPKEVLKALKTIKPSTKEMFIKTCGTDQPLCALEKEGGWNFAAFLHKVKTLDAQKRKVFAEKRKKYLLY